tara:strand:+ start:1437 stop:2180 length:744 start_codon:yes stop_codon:yes gene_type:complete
LENTLVSVCNQTDENFDVIVVSNKTLDDFSNNPKIKNVKFIEVDWEPPASSDAWQINSQTSSESGMEQVRKDKGTKYILALSQVQTVNNENHYVMFVDADDFIHKKLAEYVNNSDKDFLKIVKGYKLGNWNTFKFMHKFNNVCGTCNITKVELIKKEIDFNGINILSPQDRVLQTTNNYYLKMIIGSHKWAFGYLKNKGYLGGVVPFFGAIYNCSHDEQHSGRGNMKLYNICTDEMIKDFSIKTLEA